MTAIELPDQINAMTISNLPALRKAADARLKTLLEDETDETRLDAETLARKAWTETLDELIELPARIVDPWTRRETLRTSIVEQTTAAYVQRRIRNIDNYRKFNS